MNKSSMKIIKKTILLFIIVSLLGIITFSSIVNLYEKRKLIASFILDKDNQYSVTEEQDIYWSKEILNGGYILHFRHAERDKWIDVQMYDSLESDLHQNGNDKSRFAEYDYFKNATCLNERGKIQAKAIGEHLKNIGLPIGPVVSSLSCRARQTAELAFGGFSSQHKILVHGGPYLEDSKTRIKLLTKFYQDLKMEIGKNTIVSSHGNVINCEMFINDKCPKNADLEEGGFFILSKSEVGLRFEHEFHYFKNFIKNFYIR